MRISWIMYVLFPATATLPISFLMIIDHPEILQVTSLRIAFFTAMLIPNLFGWYNYYYEGTLIKKLEGDRNGCEV